MTRRRAHFIIAILAIVASANYLVAKIVLKELEPVGVVALRFLVGAAVTFLLFSRQSLQLSRREFACGALTGVLFGLALIPLLLSLRLSNSGITAFLTGGCALFVPFFEYLALRRKPTCLQILGLMLGFTGIGLLTVQGDFRVNLGSLWGLLSAVTFALWAVSLSFFTTRIRPLQLGLAQVYGIAILFSLIALGLGDFTLSLSSDAWIALFYLGAIGVALRFLLQTRAQGYTTATNVEIIFMLEPLFALLWGMLLAGERPNLSQTFGCLTILIGVIVAQGGQQREPEHVSPHSVLGEC